MKRWCLKRKSSTFSARTFDQDSLEMELVVDGSWTGKIGPGSGEKQLLSIFAVCWCRLSVIQVVITLKGLNQTNWTSFPLFFWTSCLPSRRFCQFQLTGGDFQAYKLWSHMEISGSHDFCGFLQYFVHCKSCIWFWSHDSRCDSGFEIQGSTAFVW